jgi:hypothetical protein
VFLASARISQSARTVSVIKNDGDKMSEIYVNLHVKSPFLCSIITQTRIHRQILVKIPNTKFHGNPSSGRRGASYGRTDRHDEANNRFSQLFYEFANNG